MERHPQGQARAAAATSITADRRSWCRTALTGLAALTMAAAGGLQPVLAQVQDSWPTRPVHLVVPFPPGGVSDAAARLVAEHMGRRLGQPMVVENRPGATGNVSGQHVARATPDGHTLLLAYNGLMTINPFVFERMPFDTQRDFTTIGRIGDYPFVIVVPPGSEITSLQSLVELSKRKQGGLDYATSGSGSNEHLIGSMLAQKTGANLVHVAYKGGGPAMADTMAGHVAIGMASIASVAPHVNSGRLRAVAVSSDRRWPLLPDVPTLAEGGVADLVLTSWIGLVGPAGIPEPIVGRLNRALNEALATDALRKGLGALGVETSIGTPAALQQEIAKDLGRFGPIIRSAGIKAE